MTALRSRLLRLGIPCQVINLTRFRSAVADGVHHPRTPLDLLRLLMRLPGDILHLHIGGAPTVRLFGLMLACTMLPRRKVVLTLHAGGYPSSPEGRSASPWTLRGFVLRRLNAAIGVNVAIVRVLERFGVPAKRLHLVPPHGLDVPQPAPELPPRLQAFREAHHPVLLTVSGLEPEYNLSIQIEAVGLLRQRFPRLGLMIIGSGSLADGLDRQVSQSSYADHVLLCGDVPHAATLRAIASADLFLRTTSYDGDSISVREALQLGTSVLATDNGMRPPGVALIAVNSAMGLHDAVVRTLSSHPLVPAQSNEGEDPLNMVVAIYSALLGGSSDTTASQTNQVASDYPSLR